MRFHLIPDSCKRGLNTSFPIQYLACLSHDFTCDVTSSQIYMIQLTNTIMQMSCACSPLPTIWFDHYFMESMDEYNWAFFPFHQIIKCDAYQRTGKKINIQAPQLHPVPVVSVWYQIGIDFIGPISPPSTQGNKYVHPDSLQLLFKVVKAIPIPSKHAGGVAATIFKVSPKYSLFHVGRSIPEISGP